MLRLMGKWKEPKLLEFAKTDLNQAATIRNAAMDALGEMACREAVPLVKEKLNDNAPLVRAKAVETLRKLACYDDVFSKADDAAWQVRIEVAKTLAFKRSPRSFQIAKQYLANGNDRVQMEAIEAIANWPIEEAGPLLLHAMKSLVQASRIRAAAVLSEDFEAARYYNARSQPKNMTEEYENLLTQFRQFLRDENRDERVLAAFLDENAGLGKTAYEYFDEQSDATVLSEKMPSEKVAKIRTLLRNWSREGQSFPDRDKIEQQMIQHGNELVPILNHLYETENVSIPVTLHATLAVVDPWFEYLVLLETKNEPTQRKIASELARFSKNQRADSLTIHCLLEFCLHLSDQTSDPQTLRPLLEALKNQDDKAALEFAWVLMEQPSEDLRRLACLTLGERGDGRDLEPLTKALRDNNRNVVRAALSAVLVLLQELSPDDRLLFCTKIQTGLERLLFDTDPFMQADVAAVQMLLGIPAGEDSLRRLVRSHEDKVRQHAVRRMGDTSDVKFLPALMELLDDSNAVVRNEVLETLPRTVGYDVTKSRSNTISDNSQLTNVRVARWKAWYQQQQ